MSQEPVRKATDVLLHIEDEVNTLKKMVQSQDQLLKLISNKLSELMDRKTENNSTTPKITIEAVDEKFNPKIISNIDLERNILISSENTVAVDNSPQGFRRNSRPETYAGDGVYLNKVTSQKELSEGKFPTQIPRPNGGAEIIVPDAVMQLKNDQNKIKAPKPESAIKNIDNVAIPVKQRVLYTSGKSVFLADVEIFNDKNDKVYKGRTNGSGKWSASLSFGNYRIVIKKIDLVTKKNEEISQNITIDGSINPLDLGNTIIK